MSKHRFWSVVPHGTNIDFVGNSRKFLVGSLLLTAVSLAGLVVHGINWGVEFVGGTEIQVAFPKDKADADGIRTTLDGAGFSGVSVQQFGAEENNEYLVRVQRISVLTPESFEKAKANIMAALGDQVLEVLSSEREGDRITVYLKGTPMAAAPVVESPDGGPAAAPDDTDQGPKLTDQMVVPNGEKLQEAVKAAGLQLRPGEPHKGFVASGREEHYIFVKGVSSRVMEALRETFATGGKPGVCSEQNPDAAACRVIERRTDYVDATVADELRTDGILAMLYALGAILLYIAIRFDFYFSPGAIVALFHDVLVAVGLVAWFQLDFDLTLVAAFLTIIGYSINDTIVVYDRVREGVGAKEKGQTLDSVVNRAINDTLSRTLLTSITTFVVTFALLVFGGRVMHGFALAMCTGIVTGTYSSFAIASPFYLWLKRRFPDGFLVATPTPTSGKKA